MATRAPTQQQLNNLGYPVTTRQYNWNDLVQKSWGSEFRAPDHGTYEFSNGRRFDSTDQGTTGVYADDAYEGLLINNAQHPDMPSYLLVDTTNNQLDQN